MSVCKEDQSNEGTPSAGAPVRARPSLVRYSPLRLTKIAPLCMLLRYLKCAPQQAVRKLIRRSDRFNH